MAGLNTTRHGPARPRGARKQRGQRAWAGRRAGLAPPTHLLFFFISFTPAPFSTTPSPPVPRPPPRYAAARPPSPQRSTAPRRSGSWGWAVLLRGSQGTGRPTGCLGTDLRRGWVRQGRRRHGRGGRAWWGSGRGTRRWRGAMSGGRAGPQWDERQGPAMQLKACTLCPNQRSWWRLSPGLRLLTAPPVRTPASRAPPSPRGPAVEQPHGRPLSLRLVDPRPRPAGVHAAARPAVAGGQGRWGRPQERAPPSSSARPRSLTPGRPATAHPCPRPRPPPRPAALTPFPALQSPSP